jgi:DNA-binding transcriptional MerR regulator
MLSMSKAINTNAETTAMAEPEYMATNDAAKALDRAKDTVLYYERTGRLKAIRTEGGIRLFLRSDVERLAAELKAKAEQTR